MNHRNLNASSSTRDPSRPWLDPRNLLRNSGRLPDQFSDLYDATLLDIDRARTARRASVARSFEMIWTPALDKLTAIRETRSRALDDLIDTHILYRCLRSSLDRTPSFTAMRQDMELIRDRLLKAFKKLSELPSFKDLEESEHVAQMKHWGGTTDIRRRVDDALLSRLFEIRARSALSASINSIEELLGSVWGKKIRTHRGQPRKYSKDFLLLKCARIFEKYRSGATAKMRAFPNHSHLSPLEFDRGPFYTFAFIVASTLEPSMNQTVNFGLEKSIRDIFRIRRLNPDVDLLVRRSSTPDDLVEFVRLSESKKRISSNSL